MIPSLWVYHGLNFLSTFSGDVQISRQDAKIAKDAKSEKKKMIKRVHGFTRISTEERGRELNHGGHREHGVAVRYFPSFSK